jgi:hypothetical protein
MKQFPKRGAAQYENRARAGRVRPKIGPESTRERHAQHKRGRVGDKRVRPRFKAGDSPFAALFQAHRVEYAFCDEHDELQQEIGEQERQRAHTEIDREQRRVERDLRDHVDDHNKAEHFLPPEAEQQRDQQLDPYGQQRARGERNALRNVIVRFYDAQAARRAEAGRVGGEIAVERVPLQAFADDEAVLPGEIQQHLEFLRRVICPAKNAAYRCNPENTAGNRSRPHPDYPANFRNIFVTLVSLVIARVILPAAARRGKRAGRLL